MRPRVPLSALLTLLAALTLAGCGDALSLRPAIFENKVDTVRMYALSGTPVYRESAYLIPLRAALRLDQTSSFDFVYDINPAGEHVFLPIGVLVNTGHSSSNSGFQSTETPFESISVGVQSGYVTADTIPVRVSDVFYVRSSVDPTCTLGIPYYAKLEVLGVDDESRAIKFRILANVNCGYRSLEVGIPKK